MNALKCRYLITINKMYILSNMHVHLDMLNTRLISYVESCISGALC